MATDWLQYGGPSRNFTLSGALPGKALTVQWRRPLGAGTSGIVGDNTQLFTLYAEGHTSKGASGTEVVVAFDATTGKTRWEHKTPVAMLPKQESFSGDPIRPQATPLLWEKKLCTLGFTGLLTCFDAPTGRVLWKRDLVRELGATPVQFGFSSSPLLHNGAFVVAVGGSQAMLVAFEPNDGTVRWKSAPAEPSYASPVLVRVDGEEQLVQLTRDALVGVSARDGAARWSYPLPKAGLTNVPTPLVLPDQHLLLSGQGVLGTRLLRFTRSKTPTELWANLKTTYFYCNWTATRDFVVGCNNSGFVSALRLTDGNELWKERGQADGNLLQVGEQTLFLRGDGLLTLGVTTRDGLQSLATLPLLTNRSWTPPTLLGERLYARDSRELVCASFA